MPHTHRRLAAPAMRVVRFAAPAAADAMRLAPLQALPALARRRRFGSGGAGWLRSGLPALPPRRAIPTAPGRTEAPHAAFPRLAEAAAKLWSWRRRLRWRRRLARRFGSRTKPKGSSGPLDRSGVSMSGSDSRRRHRIEAERVVERRRICAGQRRTARMRRAGSFSNGLGRSAGRGAQAPPLSSPKRNRRGRRLLQRAMPSAARAADGSDCRRAVGRAVASRRPAHSRRASAACRIAGAPNCRRPSGCGRIVDEKRRCSTCR